MVFVGLSRLFILAVIVILAIIVIAIVLFGRKNATKYKRERKALDELLASGAITQEEYNAKIKHIK